MNPRYVTAKRGTVEFDHLINGDFSITERALPLQSLRVGKVDEEVTFEIIALKDAPSMSFKEILKSFMQTKKILFVIFPVFFFVMRDWNQPVLSGLELILIVVGILMALLAVQIKVDSEDFISGYDRIRGHLGQKVLSKGVRSVSELRKYIQVALTIAVACGIVPLLLEPLRVFAFLLGFVFLFLGYKKGVTQKNRLVRDIFLVLIAGPCLSFGIIPEVVSLAFGFVWAFFVFFELQLEHFQFYFAQTEAGEKNLMTLRSFDQAVKILWATWALSLLVYVVYRSLNAQFTLWIGSILILAFLSLSWRKSLFQLATPAGSEIDRVCLKGHQLYLTFMTLWVAELLFQALIAPLVFVWLK